MRLTDEVSCKRVVASCPGAGMARQFRVQYQSSAGSDWRMFASFERSTPAEECLAILRREGMQVRLIDFNRCPTAA